MVSRWELEYRYDKYIESMANSNLISIGDENVDYPTQKSIQDDKFNIDIRNVSVNNSHQLLLTHDDRRAGMRFLPPNILTWLPVKLTEVLKANVCEDHAEFWWFTHDFTRAFSEKVGLLPEDLIDNLELLIRLVLSEPLMSMSSEAKKTNQILWEAKTLASYLALPTLEGFVKVACRQDIRLNGKIKIGRRIRKLTPPDIRKYQTHKEGDGICSNLGMLLWHLETEVAKPAHNVLFREMRNATGEIFDHPEDRVYGLFNDFRNDSLHGRNRAPREHGVLLNYISLVIWTTLNA